MPETNPNGSNQYSLDPRQRLLWKFYIDPHSETFGNALQSAIKAGYTTGTAEQITATTWFKSKVRRVEMLDKAEENLKEVLKMDVMEEGKINPQLLRIKTDVSTTMAKTLGKEHYSEKQEIDVKSGGEPIKSINYIVPDGSNNKAPI